MVSLTNNAELSVYDIAQNYFDAWNLRNPVAVMNSFIPGGTYTDPVSGTVKEQAIADYAQSLFMAFPDLSFEIVSAHQVGNDRLVAQWIMHGTNTGPFNQLPPSGKSFSLPGADFILIKADKIQSVTGYFDSNVVPAQLGLQVLVQPRNIGAVHFGNSVAMNTGNTAKPGAFSLTMLQIRSEQEAETVRGYSRKIMTDLAKMPGFISYLAASAGDRMFTVTAWESETQPRQIMQNETHKQAMKRFFTSDFAVGGITSIWVPGQFNSFSVRCPACYEIAAYEKNNGHCACGHTLPALAYW